MTWQTLFLRAWSVKNLTPDTFLNNPVFFNSCWTFRCNSFGLACKFKNIPNYLSFFECCRPKMFILLYIGVASLCLCVCVCERENICSVVGTFAWRNVSCEDGILWCRKRRHLLWKCKQMQNNYPQFTDACSRNCVMSMLGETDLWTALNCFLDTL
jgi:hypothetical protein